MPWHDRGIQIHVLGDANPFSRTGRSSAYRVTVAGQTFLIDCGSPVFKLLTYQELGQIAGVIGTHSHDDHRRWLGDLALFRHYVFADRPTLKLFCTEEVHEEYEHTSRAALERSLSATSDRIIDVSYEGFFDRQTLGPRPKYRIVAAPTKPGVTRLEVHDRAGRPLGPDAAKIVINPLAARPRLLFRDPELGLWVDPLAYYSQYDPRFYEPEENAYEDPSGAFRFRAFRDHCWHGLPCYGVLFETGDERLMFGSDTVYNPALWRRLVDERPEPTYGPLTKRAFASSRILTGDLNDFIERVWSPQRYESAVSAYRGAVVLQDTATTNSVVHTDYEAVKTIERIAAPERMLCVHTPDRFACLERLSYLDKKFRVIGSEIYEESASGLHPLDADVYFKEAPHFYAGYRADKGAYAVIEKPNGLIEVVEFAATTAPKFAATVRFRCELFEVIRGEHYPRLTGEGEHYRERADGRVEHVRVTKRGSTGRIVTPVPRAEATLPPMRSAAGVATATAQGAGAERRGEATETSGEGPSPSGRKGKDSDSKIRTRAGS